MKKGDLIKTQRFGIVEINEVYEDLEIAKMNGYVEPTYYSNGDGYKILGKYTNDKNISFAAVKSLNKYCFEVVEVRKKKTLVIVNACSLSEAGEVIERTYKEKKINFDESEETELEYDIDLYSCDEDYTFLEDEISDEGMQVLE